MEKLLLASCVPEGRPAVRANRGRVAEARVLGLLPLSVYNSDLAAVVGRLW